MANAAQVAQPHRRVGVAELVANLSAMGIASGDVVLVHSSLSAIGAVHGGAATVVEALRSAVGDSGTLVMPTFTPELRDPHPLAPVDATDSVVQAARAAVPLFDPTTAPTSMGAIPTALLSLPDRVRSCHPQVSVAAIGRAAEHVCHGRQSLEFALGNESAFGRLVELDAKILLLGVGHNRSSMLHHVETTLVPPELRRGKVRRFPMHCDSGRVWVEVPDVGDDNDTYFPLMGRLFESRSSTVVRGTMGNASSVVFSSREYIETTLPALRAALGSNALEL